MPAAARLRSECSIKSCFEAKGKRIPKAKAAEFIRERFDPTRDPNADLAVAVEKASVSGSNIILDLGGEWCIWCVHMDKFFFEHPELAKLRDENFVWVKVNFSPENENRAFLSIYPPAAGYPHLYVLESEGKLLHSQDTALLEYKSTYDLEKFTEFLIKWSPAKK
ncbi:MAG: thioredoxin family protein [Pyrinomonadaceae bacterium]|nr:thioredoxin family protein [Pyrinomonadaceae bacterium]